MTAQSNNHGFSLIHGEAGHAILTAVALIMLAAIAVWFFTSSSASGLF
jgi:hypothetical protein